MRYGIAPALVVGLLALLTEAPPASATSVWWDGGAGDVSLSSRDNWNEAGTIPGNKPVAIANSNAVVAIEGFSSDLPTTFSSITFASLAFNTQYAGAVVLAPATRQTLTLTAVNALSNGNPARVTFTTNAVLVANQANTALINGGAGGLTIAGTLSRGAATRSTRFLGDVTLGAFTGNFTDQRLQGTGTLTLNGPNSDFSGTMYIEEGLTAILSGTGTNMLDQNVVRLGGTARLRLGANNQIADGPAMYLDGWSNFDLNGKTETIRGLSSFNGLSTSVVDVASGHLVVASGEDGTRPFTGAIRDTGGTPGQITKRGTGTQSIGPSGGVSPFTGTLNWPANSGRINLNGQKALSTPVTVPAGSSLGFNALDALDGKAITVNALGQFAISLTVTQVNSTVTSAPFAYLSGGLTALTPAQLGGLARKTCVECPPFLALPGMPMDRLLSSLGGLLTFSGSDLRVDPTGINGPGYMGMASVLADMTVTAGDASRIAYATGLTLAAVPGRNLTINAPVVTPVAAAPISVTGGGQVILNGVNTFSGNVRVDDNTRLTVSCDPDGNFVPDLAALGAVTNAFTLDEGATLAFRSVLSGNVHRAASLPMGNRAIAIAAVNDPAIEVGTALDIQLAAGKLSSAGGVLTKTGSGRLTLLGDNPAFNPTGDVRIAAGSLEARSAAALNGHNVRVATGAVYAVSFAAAQTDMDSVTRDSAGVFGVNGTVAAGLSLAGFTADTTGPAAAPDGVADAATLFVGSSATGTISGAVTGAALDTNADGILDRGVIRLGGGGGWLRMLGSLTDVNPGGGALPTDLVGSGSLGSPGVVELAAANSFSGRVIPNQTLFVFKHTRSLPGTGDIEVGPGTGPAIAGNARVAPLTMSAVNDALSYAPRRVWLDGGQVGWYNASGGTKILTSLAQVGQYFPGTGAPPASVTLGLGAHQANVSLTPQFTITDWDHDTNALTRAIPVSLVKDGATTLDLTHFSQQANTYSGATDIVRGRLLVNDARALGVSGTLKMRAGAALETTTHLAFSRFEPLNTYVTVGSTFASDAESQGATFVAPPGTTVTVDRALLPAVATSPSITVKGGGTLVLNPTNNLYDQAFGLLVRQGSSVQFSQMPERRSGVNVDGNAAGSLIAEDGTTVRFVPGGVGANDGAFRELSVRGKAELYVGAGLSLDVVAQQATRMVTGAWMIKTGPGALRFGVNPVATANEIPFGGGIYDFRQGHCDFRCNQPQIGKNAKSGHKGYSSYTSFYLQHGASVASPAGAVVFWRDVAFNNQDQAGTAFIAGNTWEAGNSAAPLVSGDTIWGKSGGVQGATARVAGELRFNRIEPSVTRVNVANALVQIEASGLLHAQGTVDPFYDLTSGRVVSVLNNGATAAAAGGGFRVLRGDKRIGTLSGTGATSVTNGSSLRVAQFTGTGSIVVRTNGTLRAESFAPGTSVGTVSVVNRGTAQWIGGGTASTFEVVPDAVKNDDFVQVTGTLSLQTPVGQPIVLNVALAPGAQAPGADPFTIELVNATAIENFHEAAL